MKFPILHLRWLASLLVAYFSMLAIQAAVTDYFDDGNDNGWTRYDPLAPFGAPGRFSFPVRSDLFATGYRIQADASPDPATLGPARAGSFRLDNIQQPEAVSFWLLDWDNNINQSIGSIALAREPGFGTTDGYVFSYSTPGFLSLSRMDNEQLTTLSTASLTLDPSHSYRFDLNFGYESDGTSLTGTVYQQGDLLNSIAFIRTSDPTYVAGFSGLLVWSNSGDGTADATFDQFETAIVPEPSTLTLLAMAGLVGLWWARRRQINTR